MYLANGATPLMWKIRRTQPDEGWQPYIGHVVATTKMGVHPYVCWSMWSETGGEFHCGGGAYFDTVEEAEGNFLERTTS